MIDRAAARTERRAQARVTTRAAIMEAARRVAARDGARDMSLRGVAAEAGFAPAALYSYFRSKDELLLALAAEDLSSLARVMRQAGGGGLAGTAMAALEHLRSTETIAAASGAFPSDPAGSEAERLFNGRLIGALKALSEAGGMPTNSRESQCDIVLVAAALTGLALLGRAGRLEALGFSPDEIVQRLDSRFR